MSSTWIRRIRRNTWVQPKRGWYTYSIRVLLWQYVTMTAAAASTAHLSHSWRLSKNRHLSVIRTVVAIRISVTYILTCLTDGIVTDWYLTRENLQKHGNFGGPALDIEGPEKFVAKGNVRTYTEEQPRSFLCENSSAASSCETLDSHAFWRFLIDIYHIRVWN